MGGGVEGEEKIYGITGQYLINVECEVVGGPVLYCNDVEPRQCRHFNEQGFKDLKRKEGGGAVEMAELFKKSDRL